MKKWGLWLLLCFTLMACNNEESTPTIKKLNKVNEHVQTVIDATADDKFATVIFSESAASYLLLNATGDVDVKLTGDGANLKIDINHKDDTIKKPKDVAYEFYVNNKYEKILVFENGVEIPIEVWSE